MKKNHLIILMFMALIFSSCSNDNDILVKNSELPPPKLTISALNNIGIFEEYSFRLTLNEDAASNEYYIERLSAYDSIKISISGIEKELTFFKKDNSEKGYYINYQIKHNFELPGNYVSYLKVFKNNESIITDSLNITATNNKDVLNMYWHQNGYPNQFNLDYKSDFLDDYFVGGFSTNPSSAITLQCYIKVPSELRYSPELSKLENDKLKRLIINLYGDPQYTTLTNSNIRDIYKENFQDTYISSDDIVDAIWFTEKTKIVLFGDKYGNYYNYIVSFEEL